MAGKLRVRLRKSPISYTAKAHGTVRALGLHRIRETVEVPDNPATRGMVRAVRFLVEVETVAEAPKPARPGRAAGHEGHARAGKGPTDEAPAAGTSGADAPAEPAPAPAQEERE
ncbi:MAG: 50S ribosomal protein L30 [Candidatus Limnocylindrales bacterium]